MISKKEQTTEAFRADKDRIISRLVDEGESANKIRTEYGINGGWFSELLKQEGVTYDWQSGRWHRTAQEPRATPYMIVAVDDDLDDDEQSEVAELLNMQSKIIEKLTEQVKVYQGRETAYTEEIDRLKMEVTKAQEQLDSLKTDAAKWREERHRRKLEQINLSKQFAQEKIDEARRVLA